MKTGTRSFDGGQVTTARVTQSSYEPPLPVIFRKWSDKQGGDVIALFPTVAESVDGHECRSYLHVGQHGAADPQTVVGSTRLAKPDEYADLLAELQGIGYALRVVQKFTRKMDDERKADGKRWA